MLILIRATTNASRNEIIPDGTENGMAKFRIYTTKIPEQNKANLHITQMVANFFDIPKSKIKIISGLKTRNKILNIDYN